MLSVITYASQVWPSDKKYIRRTGQLQKKALKWIIDRHGTTYQENLVKLRLIPFVYLFLYCDLCFLNRLIFKHVCLSLPTISGLRSQNKVKLVYTLSYCKNSSARSYFVRVVISYKNRSVKSDLDVFLNCFSFETKLKHFSANKPETNIPMMLAHGSKTSE